MTIDRLETFEGFLVFCGAVIVILISSLMNLVGALWRSRIVFLLTGGSCLVLGISLLFYDRPHAPTDADFVEEVATTAPNRSHISTVGAIAICLGIIYASGASWVHRAPPSGTFKP